MIDKIGRKDIVDKVAYLIGNLPRSAFLLSIKWLLG